MEDKLPAVMNASVRVRLLCVCVCVWMASVRGSCVGSLIGHAKISGGGGADMGISNETDEGGLFIAGGNNEICLLIL